MTREDKQLLLKDLCARLPYGIMVKDRNGIHKLTVGNTEFTDLFYSNKCNIKPYLRPMSSMNEKELKYFLGIRGKHSTITDFKKYIDNKTAIVSTLASYGHHIDWLNKNMFDYRGLIPKELALEAPEGMYKEE